MQTCKVDEAEPISSPQNYLKILLFYLEPVPTTFLYVLQWLYKHPSPPSEFIDQYSNSCLRNNDFTSKDIKKLEKIKDKFMTLQQCDVTLLFKMLKISAGLADPKEDCWKSTCSSKDSIENILFQIKNGRNDVAHKDITVTNVSDAELGQKCSDLALQLTDILRKVGFKSRRTQSEIDNAIAVVKKNLNKIRDGHDKETLLHTIKVDLKNRYGNELEQKFESGQLRGYCTQNFTLKYKKITTKKLFKKCSESLLIISGEAGMGKTSFTLCVFHSWLNGDTTLMEDLCNYDGVFIVPCRAVPSSDIKRFLEVELPTACRAMPNTESLKKTLNEFKVLWILDGFDERNTNFSDFYNSLTTDFSKKHKIILTSREDSIEDIPKTELKTQKKIFIQKFSENDAKDVASKFLKTNIHEFKNEFDHIDARKIEILKTPYCLDLALKLWEKDQNVLKEDFTVYSLIEKVMDLQKVDLLNRLIKGKTNLNMKQLKIEINHWFNASLCKMAARNVYIFKSYYIIKGEIELREKEARTFTKYTNYCLSAFLDYNSSIDCFSYRHRSQQEFLAYIYIKDLNQQQLEEFFEEIRWSTLENEDSYFYHIIYLKSLIKADI